MSPELYITGLVAAISSLAGVIAILYKSVLAAKDQLVTTKDQQLAYREQIIANKDKEIAALQAALQAKDDRLDKSIDVLGDAVKLMERGPQLSPPTTTVKRGQGGQ